MSFVRRGAALGPWIAALAATAMAACGPDPAGTGGGGGEGSSTATTGAGGAAGDKGLPCEVAAALEASCLACHGSPPSSNAPMSLLTYADLTAKSAVDPASTVAQRCVLRMQNGTTPMPPGPKVTMTPSQVGAFSAWIQAGYPEGPCTATPPFSDPPGCSSNTLWTAGETLGDLMHPGRACLACHAQKGGKAPVLTIAGTVYPTGHEPDECVPTPSVTTALIELTDHDGKVTVLSPNANGNFTLKSATFKTPYTVKLKHDGSERVMKTPQTSGDCNACHTQDGANGAPGRIRLP